MSPTIESAPTRAEPERFVLGQLMIDYPRLRVVMDGRPVELTVTEHEVFLQLPMNGKRSTTCDSLTRRVWGGRI